jgi:hypothetical protein
MTSHTMRLLIAGLNGAGRSGLIGGETTALLAAQGTGFWFATAYETPSVPPPPRSSGRSPVMDVGLAPGRARWLVIDYAPGEHQPMHCTDTVDLDIVLQGSIELVLDDGSHPLRPSDGAVIHGVDHAWRAGPEGCRLSVTFLGTPPPR